MKNIQNTNVTWPERIKQYDVVPAGMLNKEASWEKLRAKLHPEPKRKKGSWYFWAAAAAAVILLFLFIGLNNQHKKNTTVLPVVKTSPVPVKNQIIVPADTDHVDIAPIVKSPLRQSIIPGVEKLKKPELVVDNKLIPDLEQDSSASIAKDSNKVNNDIVQHPKRLPRVHVVDITGKDSFNRNMNIENLRVQKLIRLFNADMTKEQPSKSNNKSPGSQNNAPDNQN